MLLCVCLCGGAPDGPALWAAGLLTADDAADSRLCGRDTSRLAVPVGRGGGESSLPPRLDFKRLAIFRKGETARELDGEPFLPAFGLGVNRSLDFPRDSAPFEGVETEPFREDRVLLELAEDVMLSFLLWPFCCVALT